MKVLKIEYFINELLPAENVKVFIYSIPVVHSNEHTLYLYIKFALFATAVNNGTLSMSFFRI